MTSQPRGRGAALDGLRVVLCALLILSLLPLARLVHARGPADGGARSQGASPLSSSVTPLVATAHDPASLCAEAEDGDDDSVDGPDGASCWALGDELVADAAVVDELPFLSQRLASSLIRAPPLV